MNFLCEQKFALLWFAVGDKSEICNAGLQLELKLDYAGQNVGHKVEMQS
jgi:hypothetical protein